jgi:hypothetical protein
MRIVIEIAHSNTSAARSALTDAFIRRAPKETEHGDDKSS